MNNDIKKPCAECPFRTASLPGWLGAATPRQFIDTVMSDTAMPCHMTVDYTDDDWKDQIRDGGSASYCAGALDFFANTCKKSRDWQRPIGQKNPRVFKGPLAFLEHHTKIHVGGAAGLLGEDDE